MGAATGVWIAAREQLDGLPGGQGLNIAYEAVDRHVAHGDGARRAIRWLGRSGETRDITYADLCDQTARFANLLGELGVARGERVFALCGRVPELYTAALGTLKAGAVFCPLFSAFGPEPVRQRLELGDGRVLLTTKALYDRKVAMLRDDLPALAHVLLVEDLPDLLAASDPRFTVPQTDPEDMALLHFTSGTTGAPKGAIHVHAAVVGHNATAAVALDLREDDVFWCTADPGWVTGTSYGIIAPLTHGATMIVDEAEFDADRWYGSLQDEGVTVWYTAPTALRMLMRIGADVAREYDLGRLRLVASVGEPLNPEVVTWSEGAFGRPVHDNWWQTETGGIMIANRPGQPIKPGSMGTPLPGVRAAILERAPDGELVVDKDGRPVEVAAPDGVGELALRPGWPSMFRGYLHQEDRYRKCFVGGWYRTGDLARRDADGYYWFVGRGDDVIKSAGHLIGPFEVESALLEHRDVTEVGVIGTPDPTAGELVKAFVSVRAGVAPSDELRRELIGFARKRLGPAVAPRQIEFAENLPKTRSGKIMRRLLKAREQGLPEGDTSTLEQP